MYRPACQASYAELLRAGTAAAEKSLLFLVNVHARPAYLFGQNCVTLVLHHLQVREIPVNIDRNHFTCRRRMTKSTQKRSDKLWNIPLLPCTLSTRPIILCSAQPVLCCTMPGSSCQRWSDCTQSQPTCCLSR